MVKIFLKILSVFLGLLSGIFLGLVILGTLIRVLLDLLFGWGDSGPNWVVWLIIFVTILSVIACCAIFHKWTNSYLKRKNYK